MGQTGGKAAAHCCCPALLGELYRLPLAWVIRRAVFGCISFYTIGKLKICCKVVKSNNCKVKTVYIPKLASNAAQSSAFSLWAAELRGTWPALTVGHRLPGPGFSSPKILIGFQEISQIARCQSLTPVILATQEVAIRRIKVQSQPREIVHKTLS
jgi:hypothetical protein